MDNSTLKGVKHREADRMLSDVKEFLLTGGNVNTANDRNTSLVKLNLYLENLGLIADL